MAKNPYHDLFENKLKFPKGTPRTQIHKGLFGQPAVVTRLPGTLTPSPPIMKPKIDPRQMLLFEEPGALARRAPAVDPSRAIVRVGPPTIQIPSAGPAGPAGNMGRIGMQTLSAPTTLPTATTATASTGAPDSGVRNAPSKGAKIPDSAKKASKAVGKAVDEAAEQVKDAANKGGFLRGLGQFGLKRVLPLYLIGTIVSQMRSAPGMARERMFNQDVSLANALSSMVDMQSLEMQSIGQEMELANIFGRIGQPSEASQYQQMIQSNIPILQMASAMSNVTPAAGGMM